MTERNMDKVIRVENLIIRAKNVKVVEERRDRDKDRDHDRRRDPWSFFWGRPRDWSMANRETMEIGEETAVENLTEET